MSRPSDLVHIVFLDGDNYERAVDAANERGGSTGAVVEYLAQWDAGQETDNADSVLGTTSIEDIKELPFYVVEHGGLIYWLVADHRLRYYSLYRRRLDVKAP